MPSTLHRHKCFIAAVNACCDMSHGDSIADALCRQPVAQDVTCNWSAQQATGKAADSAALMEANGQHACTMV